MFIELDKFLSTKMNARKPLTIIKDILSYFTILPRRENPIRERHPEHLLLNILFFFSHEDGFIA